MIVPVWADGRITIPAAVRRKLGIKPKSNVMVEVGENEFIIRPMESGAKLSDVQGIARSERLV